MATRPDIVARAAGLLLRLTMGLTVGLAAGSAAASPAPIRMILVGDSTVAPHSGYGDALCARMAVEATCVNTARGGRSSASFRADGSWDRVARLLGRRGPWTATYVLVQFGHNDQPGRPGRSTDVATTFPANMARYVADIRAAGARPILVTPLCRRMFKEGELQDTLTPWADATRRVAAEAGVPVIDLHADSCRAVRGMGPEASLALGAGTISPPEPDGQPAPKGRPRIDYTHLGPDGAATFAKMVAGELARAEPRLSPYLEDGR
ncbi:rhamnogalacturonan acetylesterase [Caulobacter sp. CCG-8]|uniref:rhamnogalacturonan acetylesterase n=1 Tax=Caulobacter sp. CCG-8 TaxID=3127958 RepID=UPI00307D585F